MKEAIKNNMGSQSDGPSIGEEERARNVEKMKINIQKLREEVSLLFNLFNYYF